MPRRINQMKQVILPLVVVEHATCLRLHCDPSLPLHIQFIQHLFILSRFDGSRQLQKSITQRALPMVNVRDDTEISEPFNWDGGDALFEFRFYFELLNCTESSGYVEGADGRCGKEAMIGGSRVGGVFPDIDEAICKAQASSHQSFGGVAMALDAVVLGNGRKLKLLLLKTGGREMSEWGMMELGLGLFLASVSISTSTPTTSTIYRFETIGIEVLLIELLLALSLSSHPPSTSNPSSNLSSRTTRCRDNA
jgi:hypothetical protein